MSKSKENSRNIHVNNEKRKHTLNVRWPLMVYDLIVYAVVAILLLVLYGGTDKLSYVGIVQQVSISILCIFAARLIGQIYGQVW